MTKDRLQPFVEVTARKQHPPAAFLADHTDVNTQANYLPIIAATWMFLAHPYDIAQLNFYVHGAKINAFPCQAQMRLMHD